MIFFWGTISVIQITLLPGFLLINFFKEKNIFEKILLVFVFSYILNYLLVTLLVFFNIYNKSYLITILIFELFFFIKIFFKYKFSILNFKNHLQFLFFIILILAISFAFYKNFGKVIFSWDALVSFNEWAKKIYTSEYPSGMIRPLLLPKIWSISYVLMESTEINYFIKFLTSFYPSMILVICFSDIYRNGQLRGYLLFITTLLFFFSIKHFLLLAYSDIPLIFFGFFIFYMCLNNHIFNAPLALIVLFFSCLIKISAIFYYPFILLSFSKTIKMRDNIFFFSILIIYIFSIYYETLLSLNFQIFNEMGQLNSFNFLAKIYSSFQILKIKKILWFILISFFISIFNKKLLKIFIYCTIPGLMYWIIFLSYDFRNSLPIFVSVIFIISIGSNYFLNNFFIKYLYTHLNFDYKLKLNNNYFIFFIIVIFTFSLIIKDEFIFKKNYQSKLDQIGDKKIIETMLKLALDKNFIYSDFKTNYQLLFFMPLFSKTFNYKNNYSELIKPEGKVMLIYSDTVEINLKKNHLLNKNYKLLDRVGEFSIYSLKN
jgi:hypothetical protein